MLSANADLRVLGYLGRALSLELSAVQLYSTQAKLVEMWGLTEVAEKFSKESREEMLHAERIIARMLALGAAPNASQLRPVKLGSDLQTLLTYDYAFENEIISLYEKACAYTAKSGDHENRLLFQALLEEERSHAKELKRWLEDMQTTAK